MVKVSVVIPNYNHAAYLEQRIESVINQSFNDFEIILLDDCSTDNSLEVINKYRNHQKVSKVLINEKNSGSTFKQWNKGVNESTGSYIWIAESDDYAAETFLQEMVDYIELNKNLVLVYCQSFVIDAQNNIKCVYESNINNADQERWAADYLNDGAEECVEYFVHRNIVPNASAVIFKKENFKLSGGADETKRVNGDWLLWVNIIKQGSIGYKAKPLNYYRFHENNVRSNTFRNGIGIEEYFKIIQHIYRNFKFNPSSERRLKYTIIHRWIETFTDKNHKISLARHFTIYRILSSIDRHVIWHIIKSFIYLIWIRLRSYSSF